MMRRQHRRHPADTSRPWTRCAREETWIWRQCRWGDVGSTDGDVGSMAKTGSGDGLRTITETDSGGSTRLLPAQRNSKHPSLRVRLFFLLSTSKRCRRFGMSAGPTARKHKRLRHALAVFTRPRAADAGAPAPGGARGRCTVDAGCGRHRW
ncbi:unnamed protein product [Mycena citricolor]|uniref:Uncharacterized protein n=1 Tax=Mycena citricolor TaxID=2018698 RepID=A0AAD2HRQ6_9AGAR|nr:unnamed protein product [Mycena citricolor]